MSSVEQDDVYPMTLFSSCLGLLLGLGVLMNQYYGMTVLEKLWLNFSLLGRISFPYNLLTV